LDLPPRDIQPARIIRNGGALQAYRPIEAFPNLFRYFMAMPKSEDGVLEFIQTYGPLTYEGMQGDGDVVPAVIDEAVNMSKTVRGQILAAPLNKLNVTIFSDPSHGVHLKVSPTCLLDALWLQLAQTRSKTDFRECLQCHEPFLVGAGIRRADAKFCSDKCRITFNSHNRSR